MLEKSFAEAAEAAVEDFILAGLEEDKRKIESSAASEQMSRDAGGGNGGRSPSLGLVRDSQGSGGGGGGGSGKKPPLPPLPSRLGSPPSNGGGIVVSICGRCVVV